MQYSLIFDQITTLLVEFFCHANKIECFLLHFVIKPNFCLSNDEKEFKEFKHEFKIPDFGTWIKEVCEHLKTEISRSLLLKQS
jgi:hypothetical protein